jgi:hypothetical protein
MTSFDTQLQQLIDALGSEPLCAVIIDSTGSEPSVDLMVGNATAFRNIDRAVLDALCARALLPPRVVATLVERGLLVSFSTSS